MGQRCAVTVNAIARIHSSVAKPHIHCCDFLEKRVPDWIEDIVASAQAGDVHKLPVPERYHIQIVWEACKLGGERVRERSGRLGARDSRSRGLPRCEVDRILGRRSDFSGCGWVRDERHVEGLRRGRAGRRGLIRRSAHCARSRGRAGRSKSIMDDSGKMGGGPSKHRPDCRRTAGEIRKLRRGGDK